MRGALEVALLGRREVAVEDDDVGVVCGDGGGDLVELAEADEGGGVWASAALLEGLHDARAGGAGQLLELGDSGLEVEGGDGFGGCG